MSNFILTYNRILINEGGYNRPYAKSGETYKGIDRNYFPAWGGWPIIDAYKAQYGTPSEEYIIRNPQLDSYVIEWYRNYLGKLLNIETIVNQTLADFVADFLIHKMYDAVKVINAVAYNFKAPQAASANIFPGSIINYTPPAALSESISPAIILLMNQYPSAFYVSLKQFRAMYYQNPGEFGSTYKFSPALIASFLTRVNSFPQTA